MEKIKTGMYIQKECKENIDKLKSFDVKPNEFFDKILKFDNEGLSFYLDLVSKYNNREYTTYDKPNTFITNNPEEYGRVSATSQIPNLDSFEFTNDYFTDKLKKDLNNDKQTIDQKVNKLETIVTKQQYHIDTLLRSLAIVVRKLRDNGIIKS